LRPSSSMSCAVSRRPTTEGPGPADETTTMAKSGQFRGFTAISPPFAPGTGEGTVSRRSNSEGTVQHHNGDRAASRQPRPFRAHPGHSSRAAHRVADVRRSGARPARRRHVSGRLSSRRCSAVERPHAVRRSGPPRPAS